MVGLRRLLILLLTCEDLHKAAHAVLQQQADAVLTKHNCSVNHMAFVSLLDICRPSGATSDLPNGALVRDADGYAVDEDFAAGGPTGYETQLKASGVMLAQQKHSVADFDQWCRSLRLALAETSVSILIIDDIC